jgi:hypothetical protein
VNEGSVVADEVGHDLGDLAGPSQGRHRPAATAMLAAVHGGLQLAQVLRGTTALVPAVDAMINHEWFFATSALTAGSASTGGVPPGSWDWRDMTTSQIPTMSIRSGVPSAVRTSMVRSAASWVAGQRQAPAINTASTRRDRRRRVTPSITVRRLVVLRLWRGRWLRWLGFGPCVR